MFMSEASGFGSIGAGALGVKRTSLVVGFV